MAPRNVRTNGSHSNHSPFLTADIIKSRRPIKSIVVQNFPNEGQSSLLYYRKTAAGPMMRMGDPDLTDIEKLAAVCDALVDTLVDPDGKQLFTQETIREVEFDTLHDILKAITGTESSGVDDQKNV